MILGEVWIIEGEMDKELRASRTRDLVKGAEGHATEASMEKTTLHVGDPAFDRDAATRWAGIISSRSSQPLPRV